MPMANGGTGVGSNDALTNNLAGMSKHQLYKVMVQMKVHSTFILITLTNLQSVWTLTCTRLIYTMLHHDQTCSELMVQMLIQQNQQQARQVLIANP
jgi:hypothetical protein